MRIACYWPNPAVRSAINASWKQTFVGYLATVAQVGRRALATKGNRLRHLYGPLPGACG